MPPIAPKAGWEHFSHGSDIGVRGFGETVEEAFEQATVALSAVVADVSAIRQSEAVKVCCSAPDLEILFMSWLNTVIYEMAVRRMLFSKFRAVLIRTRSYRGVAEEAPGAYKEVSAVAEAAEQARLARRVARLVPLICVKG